MRMNKEESKLLFQKRTELFMKYCDINGFPKPEDKIKFCDIETDVDDKTKIYTWFYRQNLDKLKNEIELYKDIYPNAYEWLKKRLFKKDEKSYDESRLKYFMKYVEEHGWVSERSEIRFCDIDPNTNDCLNIHDWFYTQTSNELVKKIKKYKDIYPKAYKTLKNFLSGKTKKDESRLNYLMKYVEEHGWVSARSKIRFCDIDKEVQDTINVGIWYVGFSKLNRDFVKKFAIQKQATYPKASQEILSRLKKTPLPHEERIKLFMQYIEEFDFITLEEEVTFADLGELISSDDKLKNNQDTSKVKSWFNNYLKKYQDNLKQLCSLYAKEYPNAYTWIIDKIENLQKYREQQILSFQERIVLYLSYLNQNQNKVVSTTRLKFSDLPNADLDSNDFDFPNLKGPISDEALISSWLWEELAENIKTLSDECLKYQTTYPLGVQKLQRIIDKFRSILSFEDKMQLFMKGVEENGIPLQKSPVRFCDLDPLCKDETIVGTWFTRELSRSYEKFVVTFIQYKDTYPNAYEEIKNYINHSKARLTKGREKLIESLRCIRAQMLKSKEVSKEKPEVKSLKKEINNRNYQNTQINQ